MAHMWFWEAPTLTRRALISALPAIWVAAKTSGGVAGAASDSSQGGESISMVGDSLTVGCLPYQADAFVEGGWSEARINAHGSRGIRTKVASDPYTGLAAVDALRSSYGDTGTWVVALGTNDSGIHPAASYADLIRTMMDRIGPQHDVMWVNIYLPGSPTRQQQWNDALLLVADERPGEMVVYDWAMVATGHPAWITSDRVHYTGSGYQQRSAAVASATVGLRTDWGLATFSERSPATLEAVADPGGFEPAEPSVRVLDTRVDGQRWIAHESRSIDVSGHVPMGATAVAASIVVIDADSGGFGTASPERAEPTTSTINFGRGSVKSAQAIVALDAACSFSLFLTAAAHVVIDIQGWFAPDATNLLHPVAPMRRLIDTRASGASESEVWIDTGDRDAVAAVVNVTAIGPADAGYVTVWPADGSLRPNTSNLCFPAGIAATCNTTHVRLDAGAFRLWTSSPTAIAVDLLAVYRPGRDGLMYQPVAARRLLDTRDATGGWSGSLAADQVIDFAVGQSGGAVAGTVTATPARAPGFLSVWPAGSERPPTSTVNLALSETMSNAFVTALDASGVAMVGLGGAGGGHVIVDVVGRYVPSS